MVASVIFNFGIYAFSVITIAVQMFPLSLAKIGQIVKKWQQLIKIQDGGSRYRELWVLSFFDVIDMFQIEVAMFPYILVTIDQTVKKWQQFFGNLRWRRPPS